MLKITFQTLFLTGEKMSNETIILKIIEGINNSEEKKLCIKYINEVAERCNKLCKKGESLRVFAEYNAMIETLKKKFL